MRGLLRQQRRKGSSRSRRENLAGYLFILPGLIGFATFIAFPTIFSLFLSFTEWSFTAGFKAIKWIGIDNYRQLLGDYKFIASAKNTILYALVTVPATMVLGLLSAVISRDFVYLKATIRTLMFVPYVSSMVAVAVVWMVVLHPTYGPVNTALKALGVKDPPGWFASLEWAMWANIVMGVWMHIGYYMIVYRAGLTGIPESLYESAKLDGANAWQRLRYITVPGVSPTSLFLLVIGIINAFKLFDQIVVTTNGGPGTATYVFSLYIYSLAFRYYRMGYASSIAMIMFGIIMVITAVQMSNSRKYVDYFN